MHPVISDLEMSVRTYERELEHQAIRRDSIARESARVAGRLTLLDRMVNSIRQFLDPRGFALSRTRRDDLATSQPGPTGASAAARTGLRASADVEASWREAA